MEVELLIAAIWVETAAVDPTLRFSYLIEWSFGGATLPIHLFY
jgi:hypothetical protein